jgi:hypothetical protein
MAIERVAPRWRRSARRWHPPEVGADRILRAGGIEADIRRSPPLRPMTLATAARPTIVRSRPIPTLWCLITAAFFFGAASAIGSVCVHTEIGGCVRESVPWLTKCLPHSIPTARRGLEP